jgi:hypothetical protein
MTSSRLRVAAVLIAASATLLALTSCAPAVGHVSAGGGTSTTKHHHTPKPTPTPAAMVQPAPRYSFGCSDLIGSSTVASLFSVPMNLIDTSQFMRLDLDSQIPSADYVEDLGGLDCTWYDGAKTNDNSHNLTLEVLPVTLAEWNKFAQGGETTIHNGIETDCTSDQGFNSCDYEAYVNGSRFYFETENMKPAPTSASVLPPAVKAIITAITAKLASTPAGPAPAAQHPSVTLPASGASMITAAQVRTAMGIPANVKMTIDCTGEPDGPWEIDNEAQQEVDGSSDCVFGPPYDGGVSGSYGLYEFLPAGEWAAKQLLGYTPSETQVSDPTLPAGDSLYQWTDSDGALNGDLIIGGNLIEINFYTPQDSGEPKGSVPLPTALINLANALETTIRA